MKTLQTAKAASDFGTKRLLICAEGFEPRTLAWLGSQSNSPQFHHALILHNIPRRSESLYSELLTLVTSIAPQESVRIIDYHRFEPTRSENELQQYIAEIKDCVDCVIIDISVMSKLLIVMLLVLFQDWNKGLKIVYSEPEDYAPGKSEYEFHRSEWSQFFAQPSFGVRSVVRTALLGSVVMQRSAEMLIAFTSFNEQLIPSLVGELNPSRLLLVNGIPPRPNLSWRAVATQEISEGVLREYPDDNPKEANGRLIRSVSTLYYEETFRMLAEIYRRECYSNRLILAPTGSKMQAVGCGLFKVCCPDVHIEYPIPESFFAPGFSSDKTIQIHELSFDNYRFEMKQAQITHQLNG